MVMAKERLMGFKKWKCDRAKPKRIVDELPRDVKDLMITLMDLWDDIFNIGLTA